jgi:hypothetical protein
MLDGGAQFACDRLGGKNSGLWLGRVHRLIEIEVGIDADIDIGVRIFDSGKSCDNQSVGIFNLRRLDVTARRFFQEYDKGESTYRKDNKHKCKDREDEKTS